MENRISFYLNGTLINIDNPSPDLMLIDYLRSAEVRLVGAKKGCGQGGCGACTVIHSYKDEKTAKVIHRSFNSCLRPVVSLNGWNITTVEGTSTVIEPISTYRKSTPLLTRGGGSLELHETPLSWIKNIKEAVAIKRNLQENSQKSKDELVLQGIDKPYRDAHISPVAKRLAENNGTQCGYCSTGFVMNMTAFITNNPKATKKQIEDAFDGNICRCTGFRAILTGMKTFASDWTEADEAQRMKCKTEDGFLDQLTTENVEIAYTAESENITKKIQLEKDGKIWFTPLTLEELGATIQKYADRNSRLVNANTSFGIYPEEFHQTEVYIDLSLLPILKGMDLTERGLEVGASVTYTELIDQLESMGYVETPEKTWARKDMSNFGAAHFMARRTAGTIVRNTATVAGNSMLMLHHIQAGEPFPSDLATVLTAIGAKVLLLEASTGQEIELPYSDLVARCASNCDYAKEIVVLKIIIPASETDQITLAQKVAARQVNSHAIVNVASQFELKSAKKISALSLVYGGIAPYPWHAEETEKYLKGKTLSLRNFSKIKAILAAEVDAELAQWETRMEEVPNEGYTNAYKIELAVAFLYKAIVNALLCVDKSQVPTEIQSSGQITWGRWRTSDGIQYYSDDKKWRAPVSEPYIKLAAIYQTSGQVHYTHELDFPSTGYNGAFVLSKCAFGNYYFKQPEQNDTIEAADLTTLLTQKFPAFVRLITHEDLPKGGHNLQGMGTDQPLFAEELVSYVGQSIAMVLADTEENAIKIAAFVREKCIGYTQAVLSTEKDPEAEDQDIAGTPWKQEQAILSIDQAIKAGSIFPDYPASAFFLAHIWKVTRPGTRLDWMDKKDALDKVPSLNKKMLDGNPCLVVGNTQAAGGQVHFYMETQAAVAFPNYGGRVTVHPSTQSPMGLHHSIAQALGKDLHQVSVEMEQVGGGFGGKTEPSRFVAAPVAVAAYVTQKPVRVVMPRDEDTQLIGKRHPYYGQYQIAVDMGENDPDLKGIIRGMHTKMYGDGGAFYDCSFVVSNCIQLKTDNVYNIKNFESQIDVCRTNKAPNTAMRAFGDIQSKLITENAIDDAAFQLDLEPTNFREKNMYYRGDITPMGQALPYCYMRDVWSYAQEQSNYKERQKAVVAFNKNNKWRKRGIYLVPVKYGSGYNLVQLEQASTLISIYGSDGTIVINQGGVDMGQGLMTIAEQVASYILNVPMELIRIEHPRTNVVVNATGTGASTGTPYSGEAIKRACEEMKERLMSFGEELRKEYGEAWCKLQSINYWNYPEKGWSAIVPGTEEAPILIWQKLVELAHSKRVSLMINSHVKITGGETPAPVKTYKTFDEQPYLPGVPINNKFAKIGGGGAVDSFSGFTYSAACAEVELDVLTGEVKILQADIIYDAGWSVNPAIDIGQVEGAFVQGIGNIMTEKLVFEEEGPEKGRLNTVNTWRYKPPATSTIPLQMNTYLFPRNNSSENGAAAASVPVNPNNLLSAKEVGEPPLVLAISVFFAIKSAIRNSRLERGLSGLFRFDAPATVQEVRRACELDL